MISYPIPPPPVRREQVAPPLEATRNYDSYTGGRTAYSNYHVMCMQMSSANASAFALRTNNIYYIILLDSGANAEVSQSDMAICYHVTCTAPNSHLSVGGTCGGGSALVYKRAAVARFLLSSRCSLRMARPIPDIFPVRNATLGDERAEFLPSSNK